MRPHHARPSSAQTYTHLERRREAPTAKLAVDTTYGLIHRDREEQHHLDRYLFEVRKRLLCAFDLYLDAHWPIIPDQDPHRSPMRGVPAVARPRLGVRQATRR